LQLALYWLANLMLIALGLYLAGAWNGVARLEAGGQWLWHRVRPLSRMLVPVDTPWKALALGGLWGFLPCGMVYSALLTALLSGSALRGAATMLAFGLGTVPMLLALGVMGTRMRALLQRRATRVACGLLVLGFGVLGMARALHGAGPDWLDALCLTGHP
jgi:sulfite exporter TauE/SafE